MENCPESSGHRQRSWGTSEGARLHLAHGEVTPPGPGWVRGQRHSCMTPRSSALSHVERHSWQAYDRLCILPEQLLGRKCRWQKLTATHVSLIQEFLHPRPLAPCSSRPPCEGSRVPLGALYSPRGCGQWLGLERTVRITLYLALQAWTRPT